MSPEELYGAEPLPTTKAAIYGWWWIARHRPWQEAIAASTIAEWTNDDRLLGDIGGGSPASGRATWGCVPSRCRISSRTASPT